ncbi:MAG TPA: hypothetical protein VFM88_19425, partial [Vicinamibacteria bacterium]|nr:hypothetical protein [Vicinamibacteria bacterium]
ALLNARNVAGPLAPMAKPVEPDWEPRFGRARTGRGNARAGGDSRRTLMLGVAAVLVLLGAALTAFVLYSRPAAGPKVAGATTATTFATAGPTTLAPVGTVATQPSEPPPTTAPITSLAASATPLATPPPPPASPSPAPVPAGVGDAREAFRRGDYAGAARGFEANLRAAGRGAHTVQILVACSDETLHKAQQNAPNPELFIVPVAYQGRSCYRLCWGVFDSEARARAAAEQVPAYFRANGAKPKPVTSVSILP